MKKIPGLRLIAKMAISLSILTVLMMRMDGDVVRDFIAHFQASSWLYAIAFMVVQFVLLSVRWMLLINIGKKHLTYVSTLQINLTSQLANLVFITSIGGILARLVLSVKHGASIFKTLVATVFDRLMTMGALVLLSALFLPNLAPYIDSAVFNSLSGYLGVFIVTAFIFAPIFLNLVIFRLPQTARLRGRWRYGLRYLRVLMNSPVLLGKTILLSVIAQASFFLAVFALCRAADTGLGFGQLMSVLPVIAIVSALPISMGGWGVREGAFVYGLGLLGVPPETAFLISVQTGLIGMLTTILLGMPTLLATNLRMEDLQPWKQTLQKIRF